MAIADSDTFLTYDAVGNREDLSDVIYNVDPTDCPFLTGIPRASAEATLHEWQTDTLAAASATNAILEGDDASTDAATATTRLSNTCQISDKTPRVSGTQNAVKKAGRKNELAYQIVKRSKELRRDMESSLLANNAEVTGDENTARELGGIEAWINTNASVGAGGGTAGSLGNTARVTGTDREFTETLLKGVILDCWTNGGDPDTIMLPAFQRQQLSGFAGNATRMIGAQDRELVATIDIYKSDFGDMEVIPNRFMVADSVLVLQMDMWACAYLRPVRMTDLAKTGDSERRQLIVEYCLESRNEKASGAVFDTLNS
jgi:hypothetical protein